MELIQTDLFDLAADVHFPLPPAKFHHAYRLETRRIKEHDFPYPTSARFNKPVDVVEFTKSLSHRDTEQMIVIYISAQNTLLGIYIQPGTVNQAVIHIREVIKHALLSSSTYMVLVHNHPSGSHVPSSADVSLTKEVIKAAQLFDITLHDHIIVGDTGRYTSMKEQSLI